MEDVFIVFPCSSALVPRSCRWLPPLRPGCSNPNIATRSSPRRFWDCVWTFPVYCCCRMFWIMALLARGFCRWSCFELRRKSGTGCFRSPGVLNGLGLSFRQGLGRTRWSSWSFKMLSIQGMVFELTSDLHSSVRRTLHHLRWSLWALRSGQISSPQRLKFDMCLLFIRSASFIRIHRISWAENASFGREFLDRLFGFMLE